MTRWISYSLIRLGIFTAIFVILMSLGLEWWVSALLATVMAFALSYIFFYRQRAELARDIQARVERNKNKDVDSALEDELLDSDGESESKGDGKEQ
jgi:ABC-type transport system involved in Fe-S cluster assembly fused permease/ATPase subunit